MVLQVSMPQSRTEMFFSLLYGAKMQQFPKRLGVSSGKAKRFDRERQWVFVGSKEKMKSLATQATLFAVLADPTVDTTFFTPNGYYRRDLRLTDSLRWLNAFIIDLDNYGESIVDVFERLDSSGLPLPTAIVKTPSGGHQVAYFFNEPVRATARAIRLYTAIMKYMALDLGADVSAVGANRIFRTPTEQNLVYFEPDHRYDFDVFKNWREINHPYEPNYDGFVNVDTKDLMDHPALQYLLQAPCPEGQRDKTAFTLALAMKASGWSLEQAEIALQEWFISCCSKGARPGKKIFTQRDAVYKAGYVFRNSKYYAPSAEVIRELTGLPFYYRSRNHWVGAKSRSERKRSHLHEWEADLLALLKAEKELSGTQKELAQRLGCPLTSFKAVLGRMKAAGTVIIETRKGRGGTTVIRLPKQKSGGQNNVTLFPQIRNENRKTNKEVIIVHTNFKDRQIIRIEHQAIPANPKPDPPDPGPPD